MEPTTIVAAAFAVGLLFGLFVVGLMLAVLRRVFSAMRRLVVWSITAILVLGMGVAFAVAALSYTA